MRENPRESRSSTQKGTEMSKGHVLNSNGGAIKGRYHDGPFI